ncbi:hypothetical protein B0H17DRAFT_1017439 [Mycena rosella]|uniref:MYND-type domain-containing protein n=1 Tax=Mycena rosella TaxID=1033263 RepID=A0AAD7D1D5_MYCRO|nr:hypothetical protein B0H17DRAFT_1017439 [Mycena rosella]
MPIEIGTRLLKTTEISSTPRANVIDGFERRLLRSCVDLPYAPIYQGGYGRMDASTPTQGLATSSVASCTAVVLHCSTTGRTILTHSPNFMVIGTVFVPIVDWIIGGDGKTDWSPSDRMAWYNGAGNKTPGVSVNVVVLRGFDYASERAAAYGHDGWMSDFRRFLSTAATARDFKVESCLDAPDVLKSGAVLVDKATARITYLASEKNRTSLMIDIENQRLVGQYTMSQQMQDLLVGNAINEHQPVDSPNLHLQYDVSSYGRAMPLPDEVRQLLRLMPATPTAQSLLLRTLKVSVDWIAGPGNASRTRDVFETSVKIGRPCELCGEIGHLKCTACRGAWYCGEMHQREDWKAHKAWCRSHPAPTVRPCELCSEIGLVKCSACKVAWYCGKEHQREDWKTHKKWCKLHPAPAK